MLTLLELELWLTRIKLPASARSLIQKIRQAPPSRRVEGRQGNCRVSYPSKRMGHAIQCESSKVELAFVLEYEYSPDVLEYYDQPPPICLEYPSASGRLISTLHTPDFFIIRQNSAGWEECKPEEQLVQLARRSPHRYCRTGESQ